LDDTATPSAPLELRSIVQEGGKALLLATHNPVIAEACDWIHEMKDGLINASHPARARAVADSWQLAAPPLISRAMENILPIIIADAPEALTELCGVNLLERLPRILQRLGFRSAIVFSTTPKSSELNWRTLVGATTNHYSACSNGS